MGCSISRAELRGRGKEPSLLSFKQDLDDVSTRDHAILANNSSSRPALSAKLLMKQITGRNNVSSEKKDFHLGDSNEHLHLLPEKECLKDPSSFHMPDEHDDDAHAHNKGDSDKTENTQAEAVKHTKTTNHEADDKDLEEGGVVIPKFDGPLWISSPSFRVYCNLVPDADTDDDNNCVIPKGNNDLENKSNSGNLTHSTKDIEATHDGNNIQREDSPTRLVKRKRNLRKVLTMHRPTAVINFFSVAACYNPPLVQSPHKGPRKPQGKTV